MTLQGHQDIVTSVAWVSDANSGSREQWLVSGSSDGSVILWKVYLDVDQNNSCPWELVQLFEGHHSGPVTCVAVEHTTVDATSCVVVTTGGDGSVSILCSGADGYNFCEGQRLDFGRTKIAHCATVLHINNGAMLLALGFVDGLVEVFSSSGEDADFSLSCKLSGHQNWIRGIDFARVEGGKILLATGSQDRYVRIWSIDESGPHQTSSLDSLGITKYAPKPRIHVNGVPYDIILESLLVGHEDWVMSIAWNASQSGVLPLSKLTLLSSSMDRTMILWRKDICSGPLKVLNLIFNKCIVRSTSYPFNMVCGVKSNAISRCTAYLTPLQDIHAIACQDLSSRVTISRYF